MGFWSWFTRKSKPPGSQDSPNDQPELDRSESGAPIYRHKARQRELELATGNQETIERIGRHIEQYVGTPGNVFHELLSDLVHIDVHMVEPTTERNYFTLVTSGMSDRAMKAPDERSDCQYAELVVCLPRSWPLSQKDFEDENNYWPIRWLKILARLPHEYQTWLFGSHTVPNGDPPKPFAKNTGLCCALLLRPVLFAEEFLTLTVNADKTIHFLSFVPIYREEMELKMREGLAPFLERLENAGVTELLDLQRPNVCEAGGKRNGWRR
jgi:hypothetical protein